MPVAKDDDLSNLVYQNLFVKIHGKAVTPDLICLKGSLKIHMPFDIFVGYVQENPPTSDLVKTYASIQGVELEYKIQREVDPMHATLPDTLFRGTCLPRSSLSQISSPTSAFAEKCMDASNASSEAWTWFVENCIDCSTTVKPLVRFSDPVYTGLLADHDRPLPTCPDKHQMSQRCLNYEFDLTCPVPKLEQDPLFFQLSVTAYCTRHDSDDAVHGSAYTVPYVYVTPPLSIPLLPEHKGGQGSIFSMPFAPYLFALEVESLKRTIEEINDFEMFSDHMRWGINDVPKAWRVQAGL
ncbi:hypothetical protein JOM56_000596 [Amanita muscaria]